MSKIVVALGGNALGKNSNEQLELLESVAKIIVNLVKEGNKIVITHGNGPQVGQILLAMDYATNGEAGTPAMPFPECGSMSQGYIGYQLQQCLQDEFERFADAATSILGEVMAPDKLSVLEYDYVVITIKNPAKAKEVREKLKEFTSEDKILWFKQEEIYWKYIEAAGLLQGR